MKYGIFFRHPLDRDRGLKMIDLLYFNRVYNHFSLAHDKNFKRECLRHTESYLKCFINIEVNENDDRSIDDILNFLNENWNSSQKLFNLQSHGNIFELGKNTNDSKTQLSIFKEKFKHYNASHDTEFGDIKYHSKNDCLEVLMYCSYGIKKCIEHAKINDWKYIFIFDEETKTFKYEEVK